MRYFVTEVRISVLGGRRGLGDSNSVPQVPVVQQPVARHGGGGGQPGHDGRRRHDGWREPRSLVPSRFGRPGQSRSFVFRWVLVPCRLAGNGTRWRAVVPQNFTTVSH